MWIYVCVCVVNYKLALAKSIVNDWTTGAFAICLCRDWTLCCCSYWPSTPAERFQGRVSHSLFQGIWWDRSLDRWVFLGTDFMISILASSHISKSTKSLNDDVRWLAKNLSWNECLMLLYFPFTKTLYIDLPPTAFLKQSLRAFWGSASWGKVLIFLQIKVTHDFQVVHFF